NTLAEVEERGHERGELLRGLAFRAQRNCEARDLGVGCLAGQDRREARACQLRRQVLAPDQTSERFGQSHQRSPRKTPLAISPSWICDVPSTIVSCFAS